MYAANRILLLVFIVALNGFFAASEAALVSVRRSRLRALAEQGNLGAQAALTLLAHPERLLSVVQVGVTLASLGLGWAGEDTLFTLIQSTLRPAMTPATEALLRGLAFAIAFLAMTYAHVVLGEVVPKNLALEKSDRLAVLVAPVLLVFYRVVSPFVWIIETSAVAMSRLLGLREQPHGGGHSAEELRFIIRSSHTEGHLEAFEEDIIQRVLDLQNYSAREIMVPRNNMVAVPVTAGLDELLDVLNEHQHSRVPVYEGSLEHIVGILHFRDLFRVWEERRRSTEHRRAVRAFDLRRILRKPVVVPESKPLNQILEEFRRSHNHMALVVDEFGTIVGLVTLEDVLEQMVGEIEDEHDIRRPVPVAEAPVLELEGTISIRDLESHYGIELPGDSGFETLAGFILFRLGRIPSPGESVEHERRRFTVTGMERNRIARVRVEKVEQAERDGSEAG
jgi:CBS domain containing-hemolysin-like protein